MMERMHVDGMEKSCLMFDFVREYFNDRRSLYGPWKMLITVGSPRHDLLSGAVC